MNVWKTSVLGVQRLVIVGFLALVLTSCGFNRKMTKLHEGMSKAEVISIMGNPNGFQKHGEYEALKYTHRRIDRETNDRADYNVILKNDLVSEYGMGEVRVKDSGASVLFLAPLTFGAK